MPYPSVRFPPYCRLLALLLTPSSVLAAGLPHVTFDARPLSLQAVTRTGPAETYPLGFKAPPHVGVALGPKNQAVGGFNVYPLAEVLRLNPDPNGAAQREIAALRTLLAKRPPGSGVKGDLPFFPPKAGDQVVRTAVKYLHFQGGRGVRYLVAYSFEVAPLVRSELFYTFVGLTNDGKHLLTFGYDVMLSEIPLDYWATPALRQEQDAVFSDAGGAYRKHLTQMTHVLAGLTNDPRLTRIDQFISTIRVQ
ncbi:hypothetical protein [Deinococcus humi]|uniref:Uncharacterized protein n=1 Tax=Deinococcus humi TaxID=662880 RepID=A0A7W8NH13_9DEIO|nr:hypothetical protein [Deinococcus humi]MBB5365385.1 hypothetical protein [Deinococcus humi]